MEEDTRVNNAPVAQLDTSIGFLKIFGRYKGNFIDVSSQIQGNLNE